jgi:hypothetical protein
MGTNGEKIQYVPVVTNNDNESSSGVGTFLLWLAIIVFVCILGYVIFLIVSKQIAKNNKIKMNGEIGGKCPDIKLYDDGCMNMIDSKGVEVQDGDGCTPDGITILSCYADKGKNGIWDYSICDVVQGNKCLGFSIGRDKIKAVKDTKCYNTHDGNKVYTCAGDGGWSKIGQSSLVDKTNINPDTNTYDKGYCTVTRGQNCIGAQFSGQLISEGAECNNTNFENSPLWVCTSGGWMPKQLPGVINAPDCFSGMSTNFPFNQGDKCTDSIDANDRSVKVGDRCSWWRCEADGWKYFGV